MHDTNSIPLTQNEIKTLANKDFFVIKQSVTNKIQQQFHFLKDKLRSEVEGCKINIPKEAIVNNGRIFRGENYLGYPYIMLDYPRFFDKSQVFSFRNMCWWGNHFSFTLHLSGQFLDCFRENIKRNIMDIKGKEFYYCVNTNPWEYHYELDNYQKIDDLLSLSPDEFKMNILKRDFIKLSRKIDISCWDEVLTIGPETFRICMDVIGNS